MSSNKKLKAVDFFCGGGGMTHGLIQSGINVIAGIDLDLSAKETYEYNNSGAKFVYSDLNTLPTEYLEDEYGIQKNDNQLIFVGCSPCQFYSIIRSSKEKSRETKNLLLQFQRFVEYYKPGYVLVENVPGILTNKESVLKEFISFLKANGYCDENLGNCAYGVVNMKDYGIAQNRKRFSLVATRLKKKVHLPNHEENTLSVRQAIGNEKLYPCVQAGYSDSNEKRFHSTRCLSEKNLERISIVPHDGGTRMAFSNNHELQLECYIGKDNSFRDVYGRMFWDRPSPTITTKFLSISNGRFGHPEQNRGISIREGATLQSFPYDYVFKTKSITVAARLIGNAVPPKYAKKLGLLIQEFNDGC